MKQHQITPPPELVQQLCDKAFLRGVDGISRGEIEVLLIQEAFQAGADHELEACCAEMLWQEGSSLAAKLRDRRRPKPPTLKEQALLVLEDMSYIDSAHYNIIRKALEGIN
jgi:hypothetical protein